MIIRARRSVVLAGALSSLTNLMRLKSGKWRYSQAPLAFLSAARSPHFSSLAARKESPSPNDHGFVDAKDAAAFLGIPLRSLYQYVQQGLLPSYKLGRHRLFRRHELLGALQATNKATRNEILR